MPFCSPEQNHLYNFGKVMFPQAPKKGMVKFPGKRHFKCVTRLRGHFLARATGYVGHF